VPSFPIVQIRDPQPPEDRRPAGSPGGGQAVSFRVPTGAIVAKFAICGVLALLTAIFAVHEQIAVGAAATLAVAVYALRDVIARERLRADRSGVVAVSGYANRRHLDWSQIERIVVDSRLRLGARTETLELDAGDHIFLYGRLDLGVPPAEAEAALIAVRPG